MCVDNSSLHPSLPPSFLPSLPKLAPLKVLGGCRIVSPHESKEPVKERRKGGREGRRKRGE